MSQYPLPMITDSDSDTPLPLIVAQKWNFSLAYVETPDGLFYAIQDWIKGLTGAENPARIWSDAKRTMKQVELFDSIVELPYTARDGKTYQVEHTNDKGLYLIAQGLRVTKARPALASIKRFLAASGAFADLMRREPEKAIASIPFDPDAALDAVIQRYRELGRDDRWIQARLEGKIKRSQFTAALNAAVAEMLTRRHYALATDDIYVGLWKRTAAQLKSELDLPKNASLRDHQPRLALHYQGIAEEVSAQKLGDRAELTWDEARYIIKTVAAFIGQQAQATGELLNMDIATGKRLLPSP